VCGRLRLREENEFGEKLADSKQVSPISVNRSGFGRDLPRWVGKQTVLPSNVISAALVGKNKGHPAVFPVDIPEFLFVSFVPPTVLSLTHSLVQARPELLRWHLAADAF